MWYEVPKERPAPPQEKPRAIFPWESHQPRPSRVFPHQEEPESPVTEHSAGSTVEPKSEPQTPPTPTIRVVPSDPWSSFPRVNAWDEVPEINRYVDAMQKHRRTRSHGPGKTPPDLGLRESTLGRRGSRVTDFPSEDDRPSLPVTPAPIRRPKFWGGGAPGIGADDEGDERLPAAEGVPVQSDWDPLAQLQKLAKQQSEVLLQRLGDSGATGSDVIGTEGREIPSRSLPFGSEDMKSPTYVAYSPPVVSPRPVKPITSTSPVHSILKHHDAPEQSSVPRASAMAAPSYQGPGLAFEKGEDFALSETPALPTEEERDVLET